MLKVNNLTKIYKPKKGVPVKAIDGISLTLQDKGMIFLLGKSGSGKSTLLNLLGGLDRYDEGEIIIKGVSSKTFTQQHFDSYRNTYVGFIFQEYNVLEEFSVGANIALAIELQGRRATDEEINTILKEVDLEGYANRKPNELSGGQKQRVAIARALVKNPEIIMADEPSGALDSVTGKQIFDTLKKLSEKKLVLVVSHDRDFAEKYADRIIELSDGKVISDIEYFDDGITENGSNGLAFSGNSIEIPSGYHLSEDDRKKINEYIDKLKDGKASISVLNNNGQKRRSKPFEMKKDTQSKNDFKLIKSKLPLKSAFKIGANGLKYKKIRLAITILLSCIAFGLFGLSDTFSAYNHIDACTNSIIDTGISYASMEKTKKTYYADDQFYYRSSGYKLSKEDLDSIERDTGIKMNGVYYPHQSDMDFQYLYNNEAEFTKTDFHIYPYGFNGFTEITDESLKNMGYTVLAGRLPDGSKNEIAISEYICETFYIGGFAVENEGKVSYQKIEKPEDMVGRIIKLDNRDYTVSGVIDTKFDISRYRSLTEEKQGDSSADEIIDYALYSELSNVRQYSFIQVAMVGSGHIEGLLNSDIPVTTAEDGHIYFYSDDPFSIISFSPPYYSTLEKMSEYITWIDGEKGELKDNEIIVSLDMLNLAIEKSSADIEDAVITDITIESVKKMIQNIGPLILDKNTFGADGKSTRISDCKVVGFFDSNADTRLRSIAILSDSLVSDIIDPDQYGTFDYAIGAMPEEKSAVRSLVEYCYREDTDLRYGMLNSVTFELDAVNEMLIELADIFLYIGIGFALFAALMLSNFISMSISYKKQEIGILRAIGSRSNDVFRIFFSESFIIAIINFLLSAIGVAVVTAVINYVVRQRIGILITVLNFGIRQIALLLILSVLIAAVASFIPVKRIASKKPIDAIRNR